MNNANSRRQWLAAGAGLAAGLLPGVSALAQDSDSAMARIKARGVLTVAVYNDYPPFNVKGAGIDVTLAQLLAQELGLPLKLLPFDADEKMSDDLRNMVWKGHYLGFGPADVLLHVPVDKPLMDEERKVLIFGPYYRETVVLARNVEKLPDLESLAALKGHRVAVAGQSLAGWLLIGADGGAYRDQLVTKLENGCEAAKLLQSGEVDAASGHASELHSVLGQDKRFMIEALPMPRAPRNGWAVGMAVKKESQDLGRALQAAVNKITADGRLAQAFASAQVPWRAP
jgi:ABC-type amino acid transport substrate-binding protein